MVYSRYANPEPLIHSYIRSGRFGEFVDNILTSEQKRKEEEIKKEDDRKWWDLYLRSDMSKSFTDWKKAVQGNTNKRMNGDNNLDNAGIDSILRKTFKTIQFN